MTTSRTGTAKWKALRQRVKTRAIREHGMGNVPCAICRRPIDFDAHHLNPWAYQLDHNVPYASTGEAVPKDADCSPVHRACNRHKSGPRKGDNDRAIESNASVPLLSDWERPTEWRQDLQGTKVRTADGRVIEAPWTPHGFYSDSRWNPTSRGW